MSIYMAILYIGRERGQGTKTREINKLQLYSILEVAWEMFWKRERHGKQI